MHCRNRGFAFSGTEGPFLDLWSALSIRIGGVLQMKNEICDDLLMGLAERYEQDPGQFMQLSQQSLASVLVREAVAHLRNEGIVEEEIRGVIRLTARGYMAFKKNAAASLVYTN